MDKISVAMYYNGGFPRHHQITRAFHQRLLAWLDAHPEVDVEIVEL